MTDFDKPNLTLVFPNWNGKDDTLEFLDSLLKITYPKDKIEIIVSDNGSKDGSLEAIPDKLKELEKAGFKSAFMHENGLNVGAIIAYNEGLAQSKIPGKYVLKTDNDIIIAPDSIDILVEYMENNIDSGIAGPRVYYYDKPDEVAHAAGFLEWGVSKRNDRDSEEIIESEYLTGCCMLIRKEVIEKQGFFLDENYFVYNDDLDLSLMCRKLGYKNVYIPYAKCWHKVSASTGRQKKSPFAIYHDFRSRLYFVHKYSSIFFLIFYWAIMPYILLRWLKQGWLFKPVFLALLDFTFKRLGNKGHY
ncbi:MAG: glycosyltransferase family 2 protein [Candidatus Coatesbacteria bacterium]|nr:glycosyltransferase family 2 protein [Candidatus Coatesbacteria bacterium]